MFIFLIFGDGFVCIHMSKCMKLCIFNNYSLLHVDYTSKAVLKHQGTNTGLVVTGKTVKICWDKNTLYEKPP